MKFDTQLALLSLAVGASAGLTPSLVQRDPPTVVERDLATVTSIISGVEDKINTLDSAVKAFSGDSSSLTSASTSLVDYINSGITSVNNSGDLTLQDAVGLSTPVQQLQSDSQTLVNDLIAQKTKFEANGLCSTIRTQVGDISTSSNNLINAIVAKVPSDAKTVAQQLAAPIVSILGEANDAFSTSNCTDTGSSSGSSSSSSTGSGSMTSSSASATGYPTTTPTGSGYPTTTVAVTTSTSNSTASGTGGVKPTGTTTSVPVAGAAQLAAPLGAAVVAVAAALL